MPRANTTPDWAFTTICRPSPVPRIAVSVDCSSLQKSEFVIVSMTEPVVWPPRPLLCSAALGTDEPVAAIAGRALPIVARLCHLPGAHARSRHAATDQVQIIDLEHAALQRCRQHDVAPGAATIVVTIDVAHRVEHLGQRDLLQGERDPAFDVGVHDQIAARAFHEPHEEIPRIGVDDVDVEPLLGRRRHGRGRLGRWRDGERRCAGGCTASCIALVIASRVATPRSFAHPASSTAASTTSVSAGGRHARRKSMGTLMGRSLLDWACRRRRGRAARRARCRARANARHRRRCERFRRR